MHVTAVSLLLIIIGDIAAFSSPLIPFIDYNYSISMQENVSDLWWNVNEVNHEIIFELHVKTVGWIALGISPGGGMTGADICLSWIDQNGRIYIQDRYAFNNSKPIIDTTSNTDWIALEGREMNGWTAIQFKRKFDTCDSMDVPIRTGTNQLIFAYGLVDPYPTETENEITYHENRRGTRIISLRSFTETPTISKYAGLNSLDFLADNFSIPTIDTTYYCQVFRTPRNFIRKTHAIAYQIKIDSNNADLVHHILLYECGQTIQFNDSMLPKGLCSILHSQINICMMNVATGWAVGGDTIIEYPEEAGYPFQTNFSVVYYLMQIHYNNPQGISNRVDRSGIRFILGNTLRQYDVGYLTLGSNTNALALAIPPQMKQFHVDNYCPLEATMSIPASGINVFGALPHTHLQGRSVWTTLFRNGKPINYLHNAEAYDFNYQIVYKFSKPVTLYPGDAFYTRCVYNTMNKNTVTLGGESTSEEMCLHFFAYYPRIPALYSCISTITTQAWMSFANITSSEVNYSVFRQWLLQIQWTNILSIRWQQFYDNASRLSIYGDSTNIHYKMLNLPQTPNLDVSSCIISANNNAIPMQFFIIPDLIILLCFQITILFN